MSTNLRDVFDAALFRPDERLMKALEKKLSHLEGILLEQWLNEERREAGLAEWNRVKDRIPEGH